MTISSDLGQWLGNFVQPISLADSPESDGAKTLRVIAIGSLSVVNQHVMRMYQLGYAHPHEWSRPLPTTNPNEIMRIMTKRIVCTRS